MRGATAHFKETDLDKVTTQNFGGIPVPNMQQSLCVQFQINSQSRDMEDARTRFGMDGPLMDTNAQLARDINPSEMRDNHLQHMMDANAVKFNANEGNIYGDYLKKMDNGVMTTNKFKDIVKREMEIQNAGRDRRNEERIENMQEMLHDNIKHLTSIGISSKHKPENKRPKASTPRKFKGDGDALPDFKASFLRYVRVGEHPI